MIEATEQDLKTHKNIYTVYNRSNFAKKNNFDSSCLSALINRKIFTLKGFSLKRILWKNGKAESFEIKTHISDNKKFTNIVVLLPDKTIKKYDSAEKLAIELDMDTSSILNVLNGNIKNPRKYKILSFDINKNFYAFKNE